MGRRSARGANEHDHDGRVLVANGGALEVRDPHAASPFELVARFEGAFAATFAGRVVERDGVIDVPDGLGGVAVYRLVEPAAR
ncbi:MAG TPA: hypothetical protein VFS43_41195 [Polyangiaceae bacterium]|nr:hypothetical protein [Polyangiaceae bacterium]